MTDYILKKDNKKKKIIKIVLPLEGIHIKPKLKRHESLITVQEIIVIHSDLKTNLILKKFDRMYRKLIAIMLDVTESSDSSSSDCVIALNEVSKIYGMIQLKMEKELKKKDFEKLKKKLALVEGKLKNKLLEIQTNEMFKNLINTPMEYEETKGRGR